MALKTTVGRFNSREDHEHRERQAKKELMTAATSINSEERFLVNAFPHLTPFAAGKVRARLERGNTASLARLSSGIILQFRHAGARQGWFSNEVYELVRGVVAAATEVGAKHQIRDRHGLQLASELLAASSAPKHVVSCADDRVLCSCCGMETEGLPCVAVIAVISRVRQAGVFYLSDVHRRYLKRYYTGADDFVDHVNYVWCDLTSFSAFRDGLDVFVPQAAVSVPSPTTPAPVLQQQSQAQKRALGDNVSAVALSTSSAPSWKRPRLSEDGPVPLLARDAGKLNDRAEDKISGADMVLSCVAELERDLASLPLPANDRRARFEALEDVIARASQREGGLELVRRHLDGLGQSLERQVVASSTERYRKRGAGGR
jgi:hypothetical protein